jgi:hypothetical protein
VFRGSAFVVRSNAAENLTTKHTNHTKKTRKKSAREIREKEIAREIREKTRNEEKICSSFSRPFAYFAGSLSFSLAIFFAGNLSCLSNKRRRDRSVSG